jgi:PBSX family phage terminase large subunit
MPTINLGTPNEKQKLFLLAKRKHVAFGGSRGGGKSWAVRAKAILLCLKHPGIKVMIIRKTYPELQENHIMPMCQLLNCYSPNPADRIASYNDSKKHITFPNGSRVLFRYCDNEKDAERFQGTEVDVLFIDEATHQSEEKMKKLTACVRGVNSFPKRIFYTCNPGNEGHAWVKRLFIDRAFKDNERPEDYEFIQSRVTDNFALMDADPDYVKQLEALPPKLRAAWLNGDWNIFSGQFFEEFRTSPDPQLCNDAGITTEEALEQRRYTHVIPAFDISKGECRNWTILRSYDFGYGKPFSCAWWAVDYDGTLYRILEYYGCTKTPNEGTKMTPDQQFAEISRIEQTHPWLKGKQIDGVADPAIWDGSRGESVAETAARYGVYFSPGDNARVAGWMQVHYRLQFDHNGFPRMYIFDNCAAFIRTIPLMMYSEKRPEDIDTDLEDHVADEVRYMCMSRPIKPVQDEEPAVYMIDPLDSMKTPKKYRPI